jgi:hypothetical protein
VANILAPPFWYTITLPARSVQNRRPSGANARAVGKLAAMGKAEAWGPETAGGAGAVVAGLVAAGVGLLAGELGFTVEGAGVTVEGAGEGCEAVAVTVAVAEVPAAGGATVGLFFAEQAETSSATTASRARHQRRGRRPRGRTGCTVPM